VCRCDVGNTDEAALLHGFNDKFDFNFARWVHRENISKNGIDRLLKQDGMERLVDMLSWKSADNLRKKMEGAPTIADIGRWTSTEMHVPSDNSPTRIATYILRYRDPMRAVRFFLGHPGFRDDLCYAPHRAWKDESRGCRRYTDMPSGDWWWNTQEKLGADPRTTGVTIIPLIVASDKTMLTL
jgi:hypothetical protein